MAEDNGLALEVTAEPAVIRGNRELISQALANLVENAIKYGKPTQPAPDVKPSVLIEARRDAEGVKLSVTDHGDGIPEADRQRATERFVRLEASRTLPGSGLGLSLASAVAVLHGGELRLDDAHPGVRATLAMPGRDVEQAGA